MTTKPRATSAVNISTKDPQVKQAQQKPSAPQPEARSATSVPRRDTVPQVKKATSVKQLTQQRKERAIPQNISQIDRLTLADIYHVSEYCAEIEQHMQRTEMECQPDPSYMRVKQQGGIIENNRCMLVDWILTFHQKHKLLPETLFITVNLVDRYLSQKTIEKQNLQLLGMAALLIATKYEEIYPPTVKDFVFSAKNTYTREQLIGMEMAIL